MDHSTIKDSTLAPNGEQNNILNILAKLPGNCIGPHNTDPHSKCKIKYNLTSLENDYHVYTSTRKQ